MSDQNEHDVKVTVTLTTNAYRDPTVGISVACACGSRLGMNGGPVIRERMVSQALAAADRHREDPRHPLGVQESHHALT